MGFRSVPRGQLRSLITSQEHAEWCQHWQRAPGPCSSLYKCRPAPAVVCCPAAAPHLRLAGACMTDIIPLAHNYHRRAPPAAAAVGTSPPLPSPQARLLVWPMPLDRLCRLHQTAPSHHSRPAGSQGMLKCGCCAATRRQGRATQRKPGESCAPSCSVLSNPWQVPVYTDEHSARHPSPSCSPKVASGGTLSAHLRKAPTGQAQMELLSAGCAHFTACNLSISTVTGLQAAWCLHRRAGWRAAPTAFAPLRSGALEAAGGPGSELPA